MCSTVDQEDLEMKGSAFSNIGIEIIFLFCQISLARARRFIRAGSARKGYPFEKGCRKKAPKWTRQDRKVAWVLTGILHIGLKEIYKFIFLHVKNLFSTQKAFICSFTFTGACL